MKREELQAKIQAELKAALAKHEGRLLTPATVHMLKREVEHVLYEKAKMGLINDHWPKLVMLRKKKDPGHLCIVDESVEYDRDVWEAADGRQREGPQAIRGAGEGARVLKRARCTQPRRHSRQMILSGSAARVDEAQERRRDAHPRDGN